MAVTYPQQYYNRFDAAKQYEQHVFLAGSVMQSAEFNEVQSSLQDRVRRIADVLFEDGAVISGAGILVNPDTGSCFCPAGHIYLRGAVRAVAQAEFDIATSGVVQVGVYLSERVITALEDPALRDPATGMRNYQEPGAARLKVEALWGSTGDGQDGEFFPIYTVENGIVQSKEPPPAVDAIATALSRYDRQSAGGYYVVSGLRLIRLADSNDHQIYSLGDGVARVNGDEVVLQHAVRLEYAATPDAKLVGLEPHVAEGGSERVTLNHGPIIRVISVSVTRQETVTLTHGAYSGVLDALPRSPAISLVAVTQGGTTYTQGSDYKLTADKVDWSLAGLEPAPGSTYSVTYRYVKTVEPIDLDSTGFTVADAVAGTLIQVTYEWAMPRIDRLALNRAGAAVWIKGVASPYTPRSPGIPEGLLGIASVYQAWTDATRVVMDGVMVVPMNDLNRLNTRVETLFALVAEERLALNLALSDPTAKKGVFADAFYDDDLRDQGLEQTAAIFNQELTLGVEAVVHTQSLAAVQTLDARVLTEVIEFVGPEEVVIQQTLRTGAMAVNPYSSFTPMPGVAVIRPATDLWTETQTQWTSATTRQFNDEVWTNPAVRDRMIANFGAGRTGEDLQKFLDWHTIVRNEQIRSATTQRVGVRYVDLQHLRQIPVAFSLSGFGPGEILTQVRFDGRPVSFS